MELAILELLDEHGQLSVDRIAGALSEPLDSVRVAVALLQREMLVDPIGETDGDGQSWALTDAGRNEVRRWRVA